MSGSYLRRRRRPDDVPTQASRVIAMPVTNAEPRPAPRMPLTRAAAAALWIELCEAAPAVVVNGEKHLAFTEAQLLRMGAALGV